LRGNSAPTTYPTVRTCVTNRAAAALNETIGIGKGCVTLEDFEHADGIFIIGQNPGTNHPRMMTVLERAKQNGAKIVAINPMPEPGLWKWLIQIRRNIGTR